MIEAGLSTLRGRELLRTCFQICGLVCTLCVHKISVGVNVGGVFDRFRHVDAGVRAIALVKEGSQCPQEQRTQATVVTGSLAMENQEGDVPPPEESEAEPGGSEQPEAQASACDRKSGAQHALLAVIGWLVFDAAVGAMR